MNRKLKLMLALHNGRGLVSTSFALFSPAPDVMNSTDNEFALITNYNNYGCELENVYWQVSFSEKEEQPLRDETHFARLQIA